MALQNTTELLDWLGKNLFLRTEQVDELRPLLSKFTDSRQLCKEMLQRDWLTPFQVNQILTGKADSLLIGSNRLLLRLGEGAMGQVYKAWNLRLSRVVAVKTIHRENLSSSKAIDRFRREMETASRLDHPNIVLVRDADQEGSTPFLVMDYIEGADLSRLVKKEGPLPLHIAADYIAQAAQGLQHAFERGIIHRDIKPGNLLVSKTDGEQRPVVKILDFGLARFESAEQNRLTQFGNILGTVDYISPEQAQDARSADTRSDIYSLGCTFFYLLAGRSPFPGSSMVEKITARLTGPSPHIRGMRPEIPVGVEEILLKMMARQPADRFQKPQEVAAALQPYTKPPASGSASYPVASIADSKGPVAASAAPVKPANIPVAVIATHSPAEDTESTLVAALPTPFPPNLAAPTAATTTPANDETGSSDQPFSLGKAEVQARTASLVAAAKADPSVSHDMEKWQWLVRRCPKKWQDSLHDPRYFLMFLIGAFCLLIVVVFLLLVVVSSLFRSSPTPKGRTEAVVPSVVSMSEEMSKRRTMKENKKRNTVACDGIVSA